MADAKLRGAEVTFLDSVDDRVPTETYRRAIDKDTAIVSLTHVSYKSGTRSDVESIVRMTHENGALVLIDGYQICGTEPLDVHALDVDFYVSGTLKYLLGTPGLAFLYVRASLIESLRPTVTGAFAQRTLFQDSLKSFEPATTARRYEMGTPSMPAIYGSAPALEYLLEIGMENVTAHIRTLRDALSDGLRSLQIPTKTPLYNVGPMIIIRTANAESVAAKLAEKKIIVSPKFDGIRISLHVYNALDDIRAVLEALAENINLVLPERAPPVTVRGR